MANVDRLSICSSFLFVCLLSSFFFFLKLVMKRIQYFEKRFESTFEMLSSNKDRMHLNVSQLI